MTNVPYRYNHAKVTEVIDGDTFDVTVALTPDMWINRRVRIRGIDTPEVRTKDPEEKKRGLYSKALLEQLVKATDVVLDMWGHDHYGRWVCDVSNDDYTDIAGAMVSMGGARVRRRVHHVCPETSHLRQHEYIDTRIELIPYEPSNVVRYDDYETT